MKRVCWTWWAGWRKRIAEGLGAAERRESKRVGGVASKNMETRTWNTRWASDVKFQASKFVRCEVC